MYAVQQALATSAFGDVMGVPAWKSLPSWYLVASDDQAIPPAAERQFAGRMGAATVEIPTNAPPCEPSGISMSPLFRSSVKKLLDTLPPDAYGLNH